MRIWRQQASSLTTASTSLFSFNQFFKIWFQCLPCCYCKIFGKKMTFLFLYICAQYHNQELFFYVVNNTSLLSFVVSLTFTFCSLFSSLKFQLLNNVIQTFKQSNIQTINIFKLSRLIICCFLFHGFIFITFYLFITLCLFFFS